MSVDLASTCQQVPIYRKCSSACVLIDVLQQKEDFSFRRFVGVCLGQAPHIDPILFIGRGSEIDEMEEVLKAGEMSQSETSLLRPRSIAWFRVCSHCFVVIKSFSVNALRQMFSLPLRLDRSPGGPSYFVSVAICPSNSSTAGSRFMASFFSSESSVGSPIQWNLSKE